ncbi:MAG TPA: class I SAM-dependent methyltransferase [Phycisphaerae bacterium]|nr:class I SAM-dependent methyltransferase [Phycisphaerae bacterium]
MSATVPTGAQSESDVLDVRADVWRKRPLLREIYNRYFAEMLSLLATPENRFGRCGLILELGGGSGNFKEYFQRQAVGAVGQGGGGGAGTLITSDIVPTHHCDLAADAMALPFGDESLDNLVMQDVLHHIPYPLRFLAEAQRTLRRGGRVVMTEPYISPASRVVFALAHPEPVVPAARIFGERGGGDPSPLRGSGAFASNQATPTRLFFRDVAKFQERFPALKVVARRRRSLFVYPLSGGFSGPQLLPRPLRRLAWGVEKTLTPLAPLLAFRLVVALEKV